MKLALVANDFVVIVEPASTSIAHLLENRFRYTIPRIENLEERSSPQLSKALGAMDAQMVEDTRIGISLPSLSSEVLEQIIENAKKNHIHVVVLQNASSEMEDVDRRLLHQSGVQFFRIPEDPSELELHVQPNPRVIEVGQGLDVLGDGHGLLAARVRLLEKAGYVRSKDGLYRHPEGRKLLYLNDETSRGFLPMRGVEYGEFPSIAMMVMMMKHVKANLAYAVDSNHNFKVWRWLLGRKVSMRHGDERVVEEFQRFEQKYKAKATRILKAELGTFLRNLPSHYVIAKDEARLAVVAHAGIRDEMMGKEDAEIRDFCRFGKTDGVDEGGHPIRLDWTKDHHNGLLVIWGHEPHVKPEVHNNTINIDQGGFAGHYLTMLRYPEMEIVQEKVSKSFVEPKDNPFLRKGLLTQTSLQPPADGNDNRNQDGKA